jgi:cystathionine beta-lyase
MSAITCILLSFLGQGDHLLMVDNVYSPTRIFCEQELKRLGIEVTYYDPKIGAGITKLIKKNTKLIYTESPGSLTLEMQDIPAITAAAHKAGVKVAIDNTWATPLFFKPFEHGVDVSIHSATKYIGGHSDVMMGIITCGKALYPQIKSTYKNLGICAAPDDVYLAQRGLRSMAVRLAHQEKAALEIATKLERNPKVAAVLHPALKSSADHKIWKRDYTGSSGLFSFVLKKQLKDRGYSKFLDKMEIFKMGYSWGGYESLIIPFELSKIRTATKFPHSGSAFRISVGLENVENLISDLERAISKT